MSAFLSFSYLGHCVQQCFPNDGGTTTTTTTTTTHVATIRKVAGSIPDGDIGIFHLHNSFGRTIDEGD